MSTLTTATAKGARGYQEDRSFTYESEIGTILAVFDGHSGEQTAEWLHVNLLPILLEELSTHLLREILSPLEIKAALSRAFKKADKATHNNHAGSTATVVVITPDQSEAFIAVLGDSPVIARDSSGIRHVAPEHNVRTNRAEREAAEDRGGIYGGGYICRGFSGPGLQMGRAFGDANLGRIISKEPEIYGMPLGEWLLVCSDGVTDPGHSEMAEAVNKIEALVDAGATAQNLVDRAVKIPTEDNATAILWRR